MSDSITPALTPEEWRGVLHDGQRIEVGGDLVVGLYEGEFYAATDSGLAGATAEDRRSAVAALALADQPFGFTWEDVDLLQRLADGEEHLAYWHAGKFAEIAARIAALLPPGTT